MNATQKMNQGFVVGTPSRSVCDHNARALDSVGKLRLYAIGTRNGTKGIDSSRTKLFPLYGALNYTSAKVFGSFRAEPFRFRLYPVFDAWLKRQLRPGDHLISSYGYANTSFRWIRENGGKTFLDAGNSHPRHFWDLLSEEHARWDIKTPPITHFHFERSLAMMADVDYVLSPSAFVTRSFLQHGFTREQIIPNVYPIDLTCFFPKPGPDNRPQTSDIRKRPLTLISTGSLSLRKGTPYLLEAFRLIRKTLPDARLLLTNSASESIRPQLRKFADLPIEWSPSLPHDQLADRLRSADLFILPSLEDGFALTVAEALACGLPVITTPNTGASDCIKEGINGSVVPIRDPQAIAEAVLDWWERLNTGSFLPGQPLLETKSFHPKAFAQSFLSELDRIGRSL
jgi:alpha-maltose-1-phosphate synthase